MSQIEPPYDENITSGDIVIGIVNTVCLLISFIIAGYYSYKSFDIFQSKNNRAVVFQLSNAIRSFGIINLLMLIVLLGLQTVLIMMIFNKDEKYEKYIKILKISNSIFFSIVTCLIGLSIYLINNKISKTHGSDLHTEIWGLVMFFCLAIIISPTIMSIGFLEFTTPSG